MANKKKGWDNEKDNWLSGGGEPMVTLPDLVNSIKSGYKPELLQRLIQDTPFKEKIVKAIRGVVEEQDTKRLLEDKRVLKEMGNQTAASKASSYINKDYGDDILDESKRVLGDKDIENFVKFISEQTPKEAMRRTRAQQGYSPPPLPPIPLGPPKAFDPNAGYQDYAPVIPEAERYPDLETLLQGIQEGKRPDMLRAPPVEDITQEQLANRKMIMDAVAENDMERLRGGERILHNLNQPPNRAQQLDSYIRSGLGSELLDGKRLLNRKELEQDYLDYLDGIADYAIRKTKEGK